MLQCGDEALRDAVSQLILRVMTLLHHSQNNAGEIGSASPASRQDLEDGRFPDTLRSPKKRRVLGRRVHR